MLIPNLSSYVSEGGLDICVDDVPTRWRIISLIPTSARSDVSLLSACGDFDSDVYGVCFMEGSISATFFADRSFPCLGILCRKTQIGG